MELKINNFEKLTKQQQEDLQDFIAGYTSDFEIIEEDKIKLYDIFEDCNGVRIKVVAIRENKNYISLNVIGDIIGYGFTEYGLTSDLRVFKHLIRKGKITKIEVIKNDY